MKLPVPPRPAGPTLTIASERAFPVPEDVPSISFALTRKPISFSIGSSAAASVMGQDLKREADMALQNEIERLAIAQKAMIIFVGKMRGNVRYFSRPTKVTIKVGTDRSPSF